MHTLKTLRDKGLLSVPGRYRVEKNLYLQVADNANKTLAWIFRYFRDGKVHNMGLGPLDLVTFSQAKDKALEQRRLLFAGGDPLEHIAPSASTSKLSALARPAALPSRRRRSTISPPMRRAGAMAQRPAVPGSGAIL